MNKKFLRIAVGATVALGLSACGGGSTPGGSTPGGEAPGGGDLAGTKMTVYCAMQEPDCADVLDKFKASSGVNANFVRLGAGEILARVSAEKDRPQASLWLAGAADGFISAAADGLIEKYEAKGIDAIDAVYKDPDSFWTPISTAPIAFAQNKDLAEELGVPVPSKWEDLADRRTWGRSRSPIRLRRAPPSCSSPPWSRSTARTRRSSC